jgi:hypothetical protein
MRVFAVSVLFVLGFWIMAAGGILGGGVHQIPTIRTSAIGCLASTAGLGLCLSGLAIAKSRLAVKVAEVLSILAILYGFFHSLLNIVFQAQVAPTLIYGVYMAAISSAALLLFRRSYLRNATSLPSA